MSPPLGVMRREPGYEVDSVFAIISAIFSGNEKVHKMDYTVHFSQYAYVSAQPKILVLFEGEPWNKSCQKLILAYTSECCSRFCLCKEKK